MHELVCACPHIKDTLLSADGVPLPMGEVPEAGHIRTLEVQVPLTVATSHRDAAEGAPETDSHPRHRNESEWRKRCGPLG